MRPGHREASLSLHTWSVLHPLGSPQGQWGHVVSMSCAQVSCPHPTVLQRGLCSCPRRWHPRCPVPALGQCCFSSVSPTLGLACHRDETHMLIAGYRSTAAFSHTAEHTAGHCQADDARRGLGTELPARLLPSGFLLRSKAGARPGAAPDPGAVLRDQEPATPVCHPQGVGCSEEVQFSP